MKMLIWMTSLALLVAVQAQNPKDYQWKKRVILLFPGKQFLAQKTELTENASELEKRDAIILEADTNLQRLYAIKAGQFSLILLGKDGGEKFRSEKWVSGETICSIIDAMPMRKEEAKSEKSRLGGTID